MKKIALLVAILAICLFCFKRTIYTPNFSQEEIKKESNQIQKPNKNSQIEVENLSLEDYDLLSKNQKNEISFTQNSIQTQVIYNQRPLLSIELSPSQKLIGFSYYPNKNTSEDISLVVFNRQQKTYQEVYSSNFSSWDVTSGLHWLDDNHIFFMRHCGTGCQGITLLNLESGKTSTARLYYPSFPDKKPETHFVDWFGQKFDFDGLVSNISSKTVNNHNYLVFTLQDDQEKVIGEKILLFIKSGLILVDKIS